MASRQPHTTYILWSGNGTSDTDSIMFIQKTQTGCPWWSRVKKLACYCIAQRTIVNIL